MGDISQCTTIAIAEPDFSVKFNQQKKVWTTSWKWVGSQTPEKLINRVLEYTLSGPIQDKYEKELQLWLDNEIHVDNAL